MSKTIEKLIDARASDYSFNIPSVIFNSVSKELQYTWRREIEEAFIAGARELEELMIKLKEK